MISQQNKSRNIAQIDVIISPGKESAMDEYMRNILLYKISIQPAIGWYKAGLVSFSEFKLMDKMLAQRYNIPEKSLFIEYEWIRDDL